MAANYILGCLAVLFVEATPAALPERNPSYAAELADPSPPAAFEPAASPEAFASGFGPLAATPRASTIGKSAARATFTAFLSFFLRVDKTATA